MTATESHDYRKYAVLYVDDEEQALKYFRKSMEKDFRVLTATSVAEASAILDREAAGIGVVLTDQRMPGQYGVELLKRVRTQWPAIVRLLITAYSDIESAIESVNSGAIYKYITKPCDLKALKETLKDALGLFLAGIDRETLLNGRLEVMQRMVVADRVKSLATMAGGISHHLRNSMTALTCFLEELAPSKPGESPASLIASDPKFAEQLWSLAQQERERLVRIVQSVGQMVGEPTLAIGGELDPGELVARSTAAAAAEINHRTVTTQAAAGLCKLKVDAEAATRLLRILLSYAARLGQPGAALSVSAEPFAFGTAPGVAIRIVAEGPAWSDDDVASFFTPFAFPSNDPSDLGLDMLSAFAIAYHHGGDLLVHAAPPAGPGFELRLPASPADVRRPELQDGMMQKLFGGQPAPAAVAVTPAQSDRAA
ncbi:MAG TPA: response regulator [Tepidisphaeraceae bacterium]|jgi:two-component system probable response regulator PhcQ